MAKKQSYGNESIKSLKGADRVRKRPAVIFGSDGVEGCTHSIFEIISNSLDEARDGYGDRINVTLYPDHSVEVEDFGRGIPVDYNKAEQRWNWDLVFCELYAGGKYGEGDGTYDFYLFTASDGRLLCYFDGLSEQGMFPQAFGGFYVDQEPYLVAANGSALIRLEDLQATYGRELRLHPMYNGWSVIEGTEDGSANYISAAGQMLSTLWFSRAYPFTGQYTVAYVDTGSTADSEQRYLLYVLGQDGTMSRWLAKPGMDDLVASACGIAYMASGEIYLLPDTSAPLATSPQVDAYLDCDALVVRDAESGKYGLFVKGEQHYDFIYDSIRPVESDIQWAEKTISGQGGSFTVHAVTGAAYPQPLSHSFVLERDGQSEYVALSTQSCYPIRLEGEF